MATFTGTSGNDFIEPGLMSSGVVAVGATNPTPGVDTLDGGAGDDALQGAGGNDLILGGAGNDFVIWFSGDGSDSVNGGADTDEVMFQVFGGNDTFNLTSTTGGVVSAAIDGVDTVKMTQVEQLLIAPWDGVDSVSVGDLSASAVNRVDITLQNINAGPDLAVDTVTITGSAGNDMVQVNPLASWSDPTSEQFWINFGNGHSLAVDIDFIEAADRIVVNLGSGDDTMWDWLPFASGRLTINGQAGNDFIYGTPGAETITGGIGNDILESWSGGDSVSGDAGDDGVSSFGNGGDTLSGGGGNDTISATGGGDSITGGANDDVVHWQFAGGIWTALAINTVDGGAGSDSLISENPTDGMGGWSTSLTATGGGHAALSLLQGTFFLGAPVNFASAGLDLVNVETVRLTGTGVGNGGGGANGLGGTFAFGDFFAVGDLSSTAIHEVDIDLGGNPGAVPTDGDGFIDSVSLSGSAAANHVVVTSPGAGQLSIAGLPETVMLQHMDFQEALSISLAGGADTLDLSMDILPAADVQKTFVDGGDGSDTVNVKTGAMGPDPHMSIGAVGTHAVVEVIPLTLFSPAKDLDLQNVEAVQLTGTSATDSFFVADLAATTVRSVTVDMGAAAAGGPDAARDDLTIGGDNAGDHLVATSASGVLTVSGLAATVTVRDVGPTDAVEVITGAGNDLIDFSGLNALPLTSDLRGGAGNDTLVGPATPLVAGAFGNLNGDAGDDSLVGGVGTTFISGGDGNDIIRTSGGHSTMIDLESREIGSDVVSNFHTHAVSGVAGDVLLLSGFSEASVAQFLADGHLVQSGGNLLVMNGAHLLATLVGVTSLTAADILLG